MVGVSLFGYNVGIPSKIVKVPNVSHSTHSNCHCLNFDEFRDTAALANVLTPKSDQNQISPCNSKAL